MKTEKALKPKSKPTGAKPALFVSPSAWMVWEKCALSLQAVRTPFMLERDEYAKKGTELHALIANALKGYPSIPSDPDDAALVRFAVETVRQELGGNNNYAVESPLSIKIKNVLFSGTPDVLATCISCGDSMEDDTIIVIDHKMGWREVEAEGNNQLKLYAHIKAATSGTRMSNGFKYWKGIIINARFNSVAYTGGEIEPNYLSNTAIDLNYRSLKKQFATGNHCAYCPRLSTCAKIRAAIAKWIKPGAIDSITREPERLAEALRLAKPAEKLFETIKKEAQLFIDLGGAIPGVAVEYTAGTRAWPRDMGVAEIVSKIGINLNAMYDMKVISPAQAEKIGADKDAINAIAIRPPRKGFKFI
jgi:hypothetical protein